MRMNAIATSALLGLIAAGAGCSASGVAWESARVGRNLASKDSYLRIYLDGVEAKQNKLKKGYFGHASYQCAKPVSSSNPTFRFEFIDEAKFGRVTGSNISIYKEFAADYSHQAEFIVTPKVAGAEGAMRPNTDYALATIGDHFRVYDFNKKEVSGVKLERGVDYLLVFTITGDRGDSVQVLFETK